MVQGNVNTHVPALAVSQPGHVYGVGGSLLVSGPGNQLRRELGGRLAKLCLIDVVGLSAGDHPFGIVYDTLDVMKSVSTPGALACVLTNWDHFLDPFLAADMLGIRVAQYLAWNHGDRALSPPTRSSDGPCLVFQTGAGPAVEVRTHTTPENASAIVPRPKVGGQLGQEPVELKTSILSSWTKPGDLVIEPNLRELSTLIAAQAAGRLYAGAAQDPLLLDAAIRELQHCTGTSAVDLTADSSFDERAREVARLGAAHVK